MTKFNKELAKMLIKEKKLTYKELVSAFIARGAKLSEASVKAWFKNADPISPSLEKINILADILEINALELLNKRAFKNHLPPARVTAPANFHNIDVFEMVAGFGTEGYLDSDFRVEAQIALPSEFLGNISPKYAKIIRCLGDSMEPEFSDGDYMMIEMLANRNYIKRAGIYLVRLDNIIYIKRVEFLPNNDIKLISINPNYPPFTASSTGYEWEILACVFGRISVKIGSGFQFSSRFQTT